MRNPMVILAVGFLLVLSQPKSSRAEQSWSAPLAKPVLVNQFLQPSSDYSAGHRGVDYLTKQGEPVLAPSNGTVRFVGRVVNRGVLTLEHGGSLVSSFEPVCSALAKGAVVKRGAVVGRVCNEAAYNNHCGVRVCLHFALRNAQGYLSPLALIGGLSPTRLLPITP